MSTITGPTIRQTPPPPKVHAFADSLAKSEANAAASWWRDMYERFFGEDLVDIVQAPMNSLAQKVGIDRFVILRSGKTVLVDEKLRHGDFTDVLLEFDSGHGPGWVTKPSQADFILYAWEKKRTGAFLEVATLRRVWRANGEGWIRMYDVKECQNERYTSRSVAVPAHELYAAMRRVSEVRL